MGEARQKSQRREERRNEILAKHPHCYFCGGLNPSETIDHVPPEACFPSGYYPEGFEFSACDMCNQGGRKHDSIFGLYSMLLDFDEQKFESEADRAKINKLVQGVRHNYPDALPNTDTKENIYRTGHVYASRPVAVSVEATPAMKEAVLFMAEKLTHALYLRETGKIITGNHNFVAGFYQPQFGMESLTTYFRNLLPDQTIGIRSNFKEKYGDRFKYKSGYKDEEDFFVYAAQFGKGCILWGIVCGPGLLVPPAPGPMKQKPGGCGPGAHRRL